MSDDKTKFEEKELIMIDQADWTILSDEIRINNITSTIATITTNTHSNSAIMVVCGLVMEDEKAAVMVRANKLLRLKLLSNKYVFLAYLSRDDSLKTVVFDISSGEIRESKNHTTEMIESSNGPKCLISSGSNDDARAISIDEWREIKK